MSIILGVSIFKLTENNGILSKFNDRQKYSAMEELQNKTEATYEIVSSDGTNLKILILVKNDNGIEKIQFPDGEELYCNDKNIVGIDYEVENNKQYEFVIKSKEQEENFILNAKEENVIEVSGTTSGTYPILTKNGVKKGNLDITIQNSQNVKYSYSLDDGRTWVEYKGKFIVREDCTIMVKSMVDKQINRIDTQNIVFELADDAIGVNAYDDDSSTYETKWGYMDISEEARGANLYVNIVSSGSYTPSWWSDSYVMFYDQSNNEIEEARYTINRGTGYIGNIKIPENAVKLYVTNAGGYTVTYCYTIDFSTMPIFDDVQLYPYIDANGVQRDKIYKIEYHETAVEKLYSKDNINWEDYPEEGIELSYGETIYAKSINSKGKESNILSYTHNILGIVGDEAYDKDNTTVYDCNASVKYYIYIDPSVWGKETYVKFTARQYSEWHFDFYDDNGNVVDAWPVVSAPYLEGHQDGNLTIPEGVEKLEIIYKGGNGAPGSFYEIELK